MPRAPRGARAEPRPRARARACVVCRSSGIRRLVQRVSPWSSDAGVDPPRRPNRIVIGERALVRRVEEPPSSHGGVCTRVMAIGAGGELPGCAPHTSASETTDYFLKPGFASGKEAIDLCEREAAVFASLAGDHRMPDGAMCICNPVREPRRSRHSCFSFISRAGPAGASSLRMIALPPAVLAGLPAHLR